MPARDTEIKTENAVHTNAHTVGSRVKDTFKLLYSRFKDVSMKRLQVGPEDFSMVKSGVQRIQFAFYFVCLSAIIILLLFRSMPIWGVVSLSLLGGAVLWVASYLFPIRQFQRIYLWILAPLFAFLITEILIGNIEFAPYKLHLNYTQSIMNLVWYYMLATVLYLITGRLNLSAGLTAVLGCFWGNANFYVNQFRGRIIFPADILSFRTALAVTSDYDYTPSVTQWIVAGCLLALLVSLILTSGRREKQKWKRPRLLQTASLLGISIIYIIVFFSTSFLDLVGIKPSMWFTEQNGVLLNFMVNLNYSKVESPDDYSIDVIAEIDDGETTTVIDAEDTPNIIVIMNEAFSDISVLGDFETNTDCMPFFHSLTENTIRGQVYSSVLGGNTANSEYEFLTGNTMAFLPSGTVAYQLYTHAGDYSLVGQMNSLGYQTIAMHPYYENCWSRDSVYEYYNFSESYFINDYVTKSYLRSYISDLCNYNNLITLYEEHIEDDPETPLFFFNVTMQNHGGYDQNWRNLGRTVYLTGERENQYTKTDQYLSLIAESDAALETLITYYSQVEEPTIILLFGDHQPNLGEDFYESVIGKNPDDFTVAETELLYTVPFVLWTNYDIEEQAGVTLSINYLSSLLLETAELPMTEYQQYLSEMRSVVPVINSIGYRETDGAFTANETELSEAAAAYINKYRILQYNGIFDDKNRVDSIFFLK